MSVVRKRWLVSLHARIEGWPGYAGQSLRYGRRAVEQDTTYVAFDTSKEQLAIAIAEGGRRKEVRFFGTIASRPEAVRKLVDKLAKQHRRLAFCYEAGPTGYGLYRQIRALGYECAVVAPSMVPVRPGGHIKTDRRDATTLAALFRAGELTAIWVPDAAHEAMRDLSRGRQAAMEGLRRARQQLLSFLLRHGRIYPTKSHWTRGHRRWLAEQRFEHAAGQIVFEELIQAIEQAQARRERLEQQMVALLPDWSLREVVAALQALRGVALLSAITLMAEIGDFRRFTNPRELMAWLGLVPREHSSGASISRGAITKAGNGRARRALVEGAWTYRLPARISPEILRRNRLLPEAVREVAWKAQVRLCGRYRRLLRTGKPANVVTVAIARELAAFVWAIAITVMPPIEPRA
jgi:transposase